MSYQKTENSERNQALLFKMVMSLFDKWSLSHEDRLCVLGLKDIDSTALSAGHLPSNNSELIDRVNIILAIHKSLRLLFPNNRHLAYSWVTTFNTAFDGLIPIEVIKQNGIAGLLTVRCYLENARQF